MFKCTECEAEYDVKPDYCDCGNDSFIEIKVAQPSTQKILPSSELKPQTEIKAEKIPEHKSTKKSETKKNPDIISLGIFIFCIFLALVILFFIGNPKKKDIPQTKEKHTTSQNIPSIDSFWNNSTVGLVQENSPNANITPKIEQKPQPIIQKQIIYVHDTPLPVKTKPISTVKQNVPKSQSSPIKKQSVQVTQNNNKQSPQKFTQTKPNVQPQTNSSLSALTNRITQNITQNQQKTQTNIQQPSVVSTSKQNANTIPNTVTAKPTIASAPRPSTTSHVNSAVAKQELANYKISLRNTIGRKIDFTKVVGDGNCTISFKIASNGKLINRAFANQSPNITLNDAVYAAIMATPSFNAPPAAYNNETLRLYVKFYNGNFEINLY